MLTYDYLNYQRFSRMEIKLTTPTTAFDILIPVKADQGKVYTYFYIGYSTKDPTTLERASPYVGPRKTITHSGSVSTSGTYGPTVTGASLGQTLAPMTLKATYGGGITVNSGDNISGAFLYFS